MFTRNFEPLGILTDGQIESIYQGALDVLEKTGLRFASKRGPADPRQGRLPGRLRDRAGPAYPRELVEQSLELCPRTFTMRASNPDHNVSISNDNTYFGLIAGMRAVDLDTWVPRVPTVEENNDACKIADGLEFVHGSTSYTPYSEFAGRAAGDDPADQHLEPAQVLLEDLAHRVRRRQLHLRAADGAGHRRGRVGALWRRPRRCSTTSPPRTAAWPVPRRACSSSRRTAGSWAARTR